MRIITGSARGATLQAPEGEHTRPTSERAKEAVFSMLGDTVMGASVLDLFAGSGQLGLEALSRGATACQFCDNDKTAQGILKKNIEKTRMQEKSRVVGQDFVSAIATARTTFDLVFLDPPYALGLIPKALEELKKQKKLNEGAVIVCESAHPEDIQKDGVLTEGYTVKKQTHYGIAWISILNWEGNK